MLYEPPEVIYGPPEVIYGPWTDAINLAGIQMGFRKRDAISDVGRMFPTSLIASGIVCDVSRQD